MKTFSAPGVVVDAIAPSGGTTGGVGVLIGTALFGIAEQTAAAGANVGLFTIGLADHAKAAVAIAFGDIAYWDNTAKLVTTVATSNTKIGVFVKNDVAGKTSYLSGDATARLRLTGQV